MEAAEVKVQRILEKLQQFVVPHFQRPYAWREEQWRVMWDDIVARIEETDGRPHFMGPFVTAPAKSVPEGVEKRLLIDGQQRLTTLVVLLTAIRDQAKRTGATRTFERIGDLITNRHEDGLDKFKLLPTQGATLEESDRHAFIALVEGEIPRSTSRILEARRYFDRRLQHRDAPAADVIYDAVVSRVSLVSITLGESDNAFRIFESLNAKGRPLTQADLIRNFFFMRLPQAQHDRVYAELWQPMQSRLTDPDTRTDLLTDFIRHDLTARCGFAVRETDVYAELKRQVDEAGEPRAQLDRLARFATYYEVLVRDGKAASKVVDAKLRRIRRLEVTVAYPFLLHVYGAYAEQKLPEASLVRLLDMVETFVMRRHVVGIATHGLNKAFAGLMKQAGEIDEGFVERVGALLAKRDLPSDADFRERLQDSSLYGTGERGKKLKLLLERLEEAAGHKEAVDPSKLSIEHIMPQSLTPEWVAELGPDAEDVHDDLKHTLGNLTLTGYNSELSNIAFAEKRVRYLESHLELNRWFESVERWNKEEIERRAAALAEQAVQCWPWFGGAQPTRSEAGPDEDDDDEEEETDDPTGTVPSELLIRGEVFQVKSWADVAKAVAHYIITLGEESFDQAALDQPKFLNRDATAFRRTSKLARLSNGGYVETNLSATAIHRWSRRALSVVGIGPDEWSVKASERGAGGGERALSAIASQQLEFWTTAREVFAARGTFPNLRSPHARMWQTFATGHAGLALTLGVGFKHGRVRSTIELDSRTSNVFPQLLAERDAIEAELGMRLEWDRFPKKPTRTIRVTAVIDVRDRANWPRAIEWLADVGGRMHRVFSARLDRLGA